MAVNTSVKVRWAGVHDQPTDLTSVKVRWVEGCVC